ncbi:MAG TPA: hypothetical protein VFN92_09170 [Solirubrobacterales bacterium]|nr:hypothetical protein [Solirubrobacterales bacterium]
MNTPHPYRRIALFLLGLAVVFAASAAVGAAFEPAGTGSDEQMEGHESAEHEPAGLGVAAGDYSLRMRPSQLRLGQERELSFAIEDDDGAPVTEFDELHERRMHLIVVRRDGTGFQHLHPEMDAEGTWTVPVELDSSGVYRAFADFSVAGEQRTLATDLFVSGGGFEARPFPAPRPLARTDGCEVRFDAGEPIAGAPAHLDFTVSRDGRPVAALAPYLGAKGHLVALREGDLAFLHVHPEEDHEMAPAEIEFAATFPTPGRYRLYLQFRHGGAVRTAEFTVVAR